MTPLNLATTDGYVTIRWGLPAGEAAGLRGTTIASITVCDAVGCRAQAPHSTRVELRLGVTRVGIVLRDAAGNSNPANATTWTITRTPAARIDPGLSITSAVARADRRAITVAGRLNEPHTNQVSLTVRARIGRRMRTVRMLAVTFGHDFSARVAMPSARWSTATVIARVAGTSRYLTVEKRKQVRAPDRRKRKR